MKLHLGFALVVSMAFGLSSAQAGEAYGLLPSCKGPQGELSLDDARVVKLKHSTPNQYLDRAHVAGPIRQVYAERSGHSHFSIEIDGRTGERIEVVYNTSFGGLPGLRVGMQVEACGDYITSSAATDKYPASPDGAIVHWVHRASAGSRHPEGWVAIDGKVFGNR